MLVFVVLFSFHVMACCAKTKWDEELTHSIKENIKGNCQLKFAEVKHYDLSSPLEDSTSYFLQARYPSKEEQKHFRDLPVSLSRGSDEIPAMMERDNLGPKAAWLNETSPTWLLTTDHPGQNRSYCSEAMQRLGRGKTTSFYAPLREIDRANYLVRLKNAYISPYGSVATACGLIIGAEGCETRFGHLQWWHTRCMDSLRHRRMSFEVFFSSKFALFSKLRVENATEFAALRKSPPTAELGDLLEVLESCVETSDQASADEGRSYLPAQHGKVLVLDAVWDFNFFHFLADGAARAAHFWEALRADTSILIHINRKELLSSAADRQRHEDGALKMRRKWLHLLGVDPRRVIHGPVYAREVLFPRALRCAYPASNPTELRQMASLLFARAVSLLTAHPNLVPPQLQCHWEARKAQFHAWLESSSNGLFWVPPALPGDLPPVLTIQQRVRPASEPPQQYARYWSDHTLHAVAAAAQAVFPRHLVVEMSSQRPLHAAAEVLVYSVTSVLVGAHGAGFTNLIFMPPNALLVEEVSHLDDRMLSPCGYFGALAGSLGMHHYLYVHTHHLSAAKFLGQARQLFDDTVWKREEGLAIEEWAVTTKTSWP